MRRIHLFFMCIMCVLPLMQARAEELAAGKFSFSALADTKDIDLSSYSGNVLLIVNTATQCGFAPQLRELETLYSKYKSQGLVVIGVPSNDFGGQEPGTNADIQRICELNYGVTFPMAGKQVVRGDNAHPFYRWAHQQLGEANIPRWNFHKYLVGRDGRLIDSFNSNIRPNDERLVRALEKALAADSPAKPST